MHCGRVVVTSLWSLSKAPGSSPFWLFQWNEAVAVSSEHFPAPAQAGRRHGLSVWLFKQHLWNLRGGGRLQCPWKAWMVGRKWGSHPPLLCHLSPQRGKDAHQGAAASFLPAFQGKNSTPLLGPWPSDKTGSPGPGWWPEEPGVYLQGCHRSSFYVWAVALFFIHQQSGLLSPVAQIEKVLWKSIYQLMYQWQSLGVAGLQWHEAS